MNWLGKAPVVSVLIAAAMLAAPFILKSEIDTTETRFEIAREAAREFYVHNPRLAVDALGELILEPAWLEEARAAAWASFGADPGWQAAKKDSEVDGPLVVKQHVSLLEPAIADLPLA